MAGKKYLVTGAAGFIGFHTAQKLLARGETVVGYDNLNPYYPVEYKHARLKQLVGQPGFSFQEADLTERERLRQLCEHEKFYVVINLAAQAGVRYSLENPHAYVEANLVGFVNILEACRYSGVCISCMRRRAAFMGRIPTTRFRSITTSIIPSAFMPRRRRPTS